MTKAWPDDIITPVIGCKKVKTHGITVNYTMVRLSTKNFSLATAQKGQLLGP